MEEAATEVVEAVEVDSPAEAAVEVAAADSPVAEAAEEDTAKINTSRIARCIFLMCCQHITGVEKFVQLLFAQ